MEFLGALSADAAVALAQRSVSVDYLHIDADHSLEVSPLAMHMTGMHLLHVDLQVHASVHIPARVYICLQGVTVNLEACVPLLGVPGAW